MWEDASLKLSLSSSARLGVISLSAFSLASLQLPCCSIFTGGIKHPGRAPLGRDLDSVRPGLAFLLVGNGPHKECSSNGRTHLDLWLQICKLPLKPQTRMVQLTQDEGVGEDTSLHRHNHRQPTHRGRPAMEVRSPASGLGTASAVWLCSQVTEP